MKRLSFASEVSMVALLLKIESKSKRLRRKFCCHSFAAFSIDDCAKDGGEEL